MIWEIPVREPHVESDCTRPATVLPTIQPSLRRQFFHTVAFFLFSSFLGSADRYDVGIPKFSPVIPWDQNCLLNSLCSPRLL